jgi:hypothetical protein
VVALGAAALIAFPTAASAQPGTGVIHEEGMSSSAPVREMATSPV